MERLIPWPPSAEEGSAPFVGVFVQHLGKAQYHCGFFYFAPGQNPEVLHHQLSGQLSNQVPVKQVLGVPLDVDPVRAQAIARRVRQVAARHQNVGIKFAFSSPDQHWFSSDGFALVGEDQVGLTCSHFVLALFGFAGLKLVHVETWPVRPEDTEWQTKMIPHIQMTWTEEGEHTALFTEQISKEIGMKRVRPDEVGGAILAGSENLPASFEVVEPLSGEIRARLA